MNKPALTSMNSLLSASNTARAPHANITNAGHLFGDVDYGDTDDFMGDPNQDPFYGDAEYYGDTEEGDALYGDTSSAPLAYYDTLIGDPKKKNWFARLPKGVKLAGAGILGAGGAYLTGRALNNVIQKQLQKRRGAVGKLRSSERQQTIQTQIQRRRNLGIIPRNSAFPFFQVMGATLNSSQIAPTESFPADTLKWILDKQNVETPFEVEVAPGVFAGVTFTCTASGLATNRYYAAVIITIGINALAGNPGTIFNVTGSLPTANGPLTISTAFSCTILKGFDAKMLIFPWQLVTNKPLPVAGQYSNTNPIVINVTGLPSSSVVNTIVPGSLHTWTIGLRNSLLKH